MRHRCETALPRLPRPVPMPEPTPWPLQPEPAPAAASIQQPVRAQRLPSDEAWQTPPAEPMVMPSPVPEVRPVRPRRHARRSCRGTRAPERAGRRPARSKCSPPKSNPARSSRRRVSPPRSLSAPPAQAQPSPAADQSLAEMAQRLEAALRRPTAQKVVAETARVTATVDVKAGTPKAAVQPRAAPPEVTG
jgi:hypothetical protein